MERFRRALVIGASGQVGAALGQALEQQPGGCAVSRSSRVPRPGWETVDLGTLSTPEDGALLFELTEPDLVLCSGGMTYVDGCEQSPAQCMQANTLGPAAVAAQAYRRGAGFVFFSSDYVFDGSAETPGPYDETSPTRPLSVYGRSKLLGEERVLEAHPQALIVRTTVVYGPDAAGKNFLYTLLRHLWSGAPLRVPHDQISTPTYNRDLAEAVLALLSHGVDGIVHVAGPERMDRLQFAQEVAAFFGLDAGNVQGVDTASLGQTAGRPLLSGLATGRLRALLPSLPQRTLHAALRDCEPDMRRYLAELSVQKAPALR